MKTLRYKGYLIVFVLTCLNGYGQTISSHRGNSLDLFNAGIGFNNIGFVDSYLSSQKYMGIWPDLHVNWLRQTPQHLINIGLSGGGSNEISNYGLNSDFSKGKVYGEYLIRLKSINEKIPKVNLNIGPGLSYNSYWMSQMMAYTSPTSSEIDLISLNFSCRLEWMLSPGLSATLNAESAVFSRIGKKVDLSKYHEYKPEWTTITGVRMYECGIDVWWIPLKHFGLQLSYLGSWMATDKWNDFRLFNHNISLGILFTFAN